MKYETYTDEEFENTLRAHEPHGHDARTAQQLINALYRRVLAVESEVVKLRDTLNR